jgi:hypothetical protein
MKNNVHASPPVLASIFAFVGLGIAGQALADDVRSLPEVEVTSSRYSLIGVADNASEGVAGPFHAWARCSRSFLD